MVRYEKCNTPCPEEMPCIHGACSYYRVRAYYCDNCREPAAYEYEGRHYCMDCLEEELDVEFDRLSVWEKVEALALEDQVTEL